MIETTLNGKTKDIVQDNIEQLKQLFPEIITEGKIDFDKLKEVLGKEIDDTNERYDFTWKGKHEAVKISQTPSEGTLRPSKEDSKNWDTTENLYIEGDNLEVLKLLQKSYYGKIKMIYLDPPYNTGNDFVYEDDFRDNLKNYLEQDEEGFNVSSNPETSGRYHTNWLNMIYPRLKLARNLLSEEGVIFISIDDNELNNLKKLCDEIFGEINFIGQFNWYKSQTPPNLSLKLTKNIEYILCYEKKRDNTKYKGLKKESKSTDPITKPNNTIKELKFPINSLNIKIKEDTIKKGVYGTEKYPNELLNDMVIKNNTNTNEVIFRNKFIWTQEKLDEELSKGTQIFLSKSLVLSFKKSEYDNQVPANYISAEVGNTTENAGKYIQKLFGKKIFDYPKPTDLIEYLFNFKISKEDIFLDFFSGSSTTAEAVMNINFKNNTRNKFIMVQLPENTDKNTEAFKAGYKNICEIGKERIRRVGDKILEENPKSNLDIGFKVFKLDSSNLTKWNPDVDNLENSLVAASDNIVEGRSELDLVYEIMLKYGVELTESVEEISFDKYNFYSVDDGALVICLNNHVTRDVAEDILKIKEDLSPDIIRVVFKDNGFEGDADKTNVKEILRNNQVDEFITI